MTSSISGNYGSYSSHSAAGTRQRPDASQMAEKLFSKLDTKNQGYIDKSDLESAFANISGATGSDSSAGIDDVLSQFDGDGDGKITKDEMTSGFKQLADELDSQFSQMRMNGFGGHGHGGMPPGPPPQGGGNSSSSSGSADGSTAGSSSISESSEAKVMHKIMQLMHAYGRGEDDTSQSAAASLLSVAA